MKEAKKYQAQRHLLNENVHSINQTMLTKRLLYNKPGFATVKHELVWYALGKKTQTKSFAKISIKSLWM